MDCNNGSYIHFTKPHLCTPTHVQHGWKQEAGIHQYQLSHYLTFMVSYMLTHTGTHTHEKEIKILLTHFSWSCLMSLHFDWEHRTRSNQMFDTVVKMWGFSNALLPQSLTLMGTGDRKPFSRRHSLCPSGPVVKLTSVRSEVLSLDQVFHEGSYLKRLIEEVPVRDLT